MRPSYVLRQKKRTGREVFPETLCGISGNIGFNDIDVKEIEFAHTILYNKKSVAKYTLWTKLYIFVLQY